MPEGADAAGKRACPEVPSLRLNTGALIPVVGLGTWKSKPGEVQEAVKAALACGYRHIDCAAVYGNESEVGEGVKLSGVPREEIFITSKLWNAEHAAADVEPACRKTLKDLGTDYLDLYLIHWPVCLRRGHSMPPTKDDFIDIPLEETWKALESLVEKGLCKAIGLSNFSAKRMEHLLSFAKVKPAMNQVEGHPYLQQPKLKEFCEKHGILLTCYGPLGSPDRPARVVDESDPVLMEDATLVEIGKSAGRPVADVLIRWAVQRGTIVIPKSVTPSRIDSNLKTALDPLPADTMEKLGAMDRHLRLFKGHLWTPEGTTGPIKDANVDLWQD
jgi:alcohol dehydrogenase (NADP+)